MTSESAQERDELAGEYVLGTLSFEQRIEVQRRLPDDPELRAAVDAWERRLLELTDYAEAQQPSALLWPRIERSVERLTHETPTTSWWNLLPLWRGLFGRFPQAELQRAHEAGGADDRCDDEIEDEGAGGRHETF